MDFSEGLDLDEGDNASRLTSKGHRTDPRVFKSLLDGYTESFKFTKAEPMHLADNFDPGDLTFGIPFRGGVGEPNEYQAIYNPSYADSSHPQAPRLVSEKTGPPFHRRNHKGLFPMPDRSPQAFTQRSFNSIGQVMPSNVHAGHIHPRGYWNSGQNTPACYTQDPLLLYGATASDLTDNIGPSIPEHEYYAGPACRLPLSYTSPVVRNTTTNPVDVPGGSEYIPRSASLGMDIPTYPPYGSLERPISQSIHRIYHQAQTGASQPMSHIGDSYIPPMVAEMSQPPSHSDDGCYPNFGSGPIAIGTSFQNVMQVSKSPFDSTMTVLPVDVQGGDQIPVMDWTHSNEPKFIWGGQGTASGSSPESRHICASSSRPGVNLPSPSHSLGSIAGTPILQQVEPESTGFACGFAPKEIRNPGGLERKNEIPEGFQNVFDLKTGKRPTTKSRRRASSTQRQNTMYVRKVGACKICRAGKRRCEHKLKKQDKGTPTIDMASLPRKRGRKKRIGVSRSAPVGYIQSRRSSNSLIAPSNTPIQRRQSNTSLETYATSNTSFSAESTGGPAMTSHDSPAEGDIHTPIESQGDEQVIERVTNHPNGTEGEWREAMVAMVNERTRWLPGTFFVPQLPLRPVTDVRPSPPSRQYQEMNSNPFGSTPAMYDEVSLRSYPDNSTSGLEYIEATNKPYWRKHTHRS